ncbi:beta-ketoacyl synthase chain length factor [Mucilaginibacter sp. RS28]|uniref:Beta-ketoacyl synthase chain length factor n=1 Tax=Mucilaginibacter straminoryzae TaxID=2932774 RepID=A0A9X1X3J1_9SPHI|nr:beta-ketoacyl synthase N-terminal-like domain-containing protein [Mucilaginibacter straminoryzae]MCJ8210562.1 beta-ketoacyl synthase chain length factor [Mucilaginibacter straminoryzae]
MKLFIRSATCISPQHTFGEGPYLKDVVIYDQPRLPVIEPDYKPFIDPKQSRRMSRVIRMGIAAAKEALQQANITLPDAIVTGTAYGCVEDSGNFLTRLIEMEEEMLSPTAFIQSTHNTVAAQIALAIKCHAYNNTFVHKSFSFESALMDAAMLLAEGEAKEVLTGGVDEITDINYAIFNRFNIFKKGDFKNTDLYNSNTSGTIAGEGAAFFVLGKEPAANDLARLDAFRTIYKPIDIKQDILKFLDEAGCPLKEVDLVLTGRNGDPRTDAPYDLLSSGLFANLPVANYKHLCGEYPVASSFALWLAAQIVSQGQVFPALAIQANVSPKRILIANNYQDKYWSLMLLSQC